MKTRLRSPLTILLILSALILIGCDSISLRNIDPTDIAYVGLKLSDRTGMRFRTVAPKSNEEIIVDEGTTYEVYMLSSAEKQKLTDELESTRQAVSRIFTSNSTAAPATTTKFIQDLDRKIGDILVTGFKCSGKIGTSSSLNPLENETYTYPVQLARQISTGLWDCTILARE